MEFGETKAFENFKKDITKIKSLSTNRLLIKSMVDLVKKSIGRIGKSNESLMILFKPISC